MDKTPPFSIPFEDLTAFCRRYQVQELSLFGSALRPDYQQNSDVDLLVNFKKGARITFTTLARMQRELESLIKRKVDLVPKKSLKPLIRDQVLTTAKVLYEE
jgi:predicted nucleotidyltransferase